MSTAIDAAPEERETVMTVAEDAREGVARWRADGGFFITSFARCCYGIAGIGDKDTTFAYTELRGARAPLPDD